MKIDRLSKPTDVGGHPMRKVIIYTVDKIYQGKNLKHTNQCGM